MEQLCTKVKKSGAYRPITHIFIISQNIPINQISLYIFVSQCLFTFFADEKKI